VWFIKAGSVRPLLMQPSQVAWAKDIFFTASFGKYSEWSMHISFFFVRLSKILTAKNHAGEYQKKNKLKLNLSSKV